MRRFIAIAFRICFVEWH